MATVCPEDLDALLAEFAGRAGSYSADTSADVSDLGMILLLGVSLAIAIDMVDVNWRRSVLSNSDQYDPAQEAEITRYYREWMDGAGGIVLHLDRLEAGGVVLKWSDQFRKAYSGARGVLILDDQFFSGDALTQLRDEAIDAHRAGRTEAYHGQGEN